MVEHGLFIWGHNFAAQELGNGSSGVYLWSTCHCLGRLGWQMPLQSSFFRCMSEVSELRGHSISTWYVIFLRPLHLALTSHSLGISGEWRFPHNSWLPGYWSRTVRLLKTQPQKSQNSVPVMVYWPRKSLSPAHIQGEGNSDCNSQRKRVAKKLQPSFIYQSYILYLPL